MQLEELNPVLVKRQGLTPSGNVGGYLDPLSGGTLGKRGGGNYLDPLSGGTLGKRQFFDALGGEALAGKRSANLRSRLFASEGFFKLPLMFRGY